VHFAFLDRMKKTPATDTRPLIETALLQASRPGYSGLNSSKKRRNLLRSAIQLES
jgi:hypothetical protein